MTRDEELVIALALYEAMNHNIDALLAGDEEHATEGFLRVDAILDKLEGKLPDA